MMNTEKKVTTHPLLVGWISGAHPPCRHSWWMRPSGLSTLPHPAPFDRQREQLQKKKGFTLIELMITVAVIGILAAIGYPSYTDYVMKSRRSDAKAALLQVQLAQEKYRANNPTYGTLAEIGLGSSSPDNNYTITVTLENSDAEYTAAAAPAGKQVGDKCGTFQIDEAGTKSVTGAASGYDATTCW